MYETVVLKNVYPLLYGVSFTGSLLVSFCLQIAYNKMRNLQIGLDKLVGKVLINLLRHTKSVAWVSIIINVPAVAYAIVT